MIQIEFLIHQKYTLSRIFNNFKFDEILKLKISLVSLIKENKFPI